jgi:hypothetical protein
LPLGKAGLAASPRLGSAFVQGQQSLGPLAPWSFPGGKLFANAPLLRAEQLACGLLLFQSLLSQFFRFQAISPCFVGFYKMLNTYFSHNP